MKTTTLLDVLALSGALGSGLMAGFFFAFSVCVMNALERLPPAQGTAAMQTINVVVINPWFLTVFLGTTVLGVIVAIFAGIARHEAGARYLLIGGVTYVIGTFLVTMRLNVPLNSALAAATAGSSESTALWARYLSVWTKWNHVRTLASLMSAAAFCLALKR